jgi:hypothetical protein
MIVDELLSWRNEYESTGGDMNNEKENKKLLLNDKELDQVTGGSGFTRPRIARNVEPDVMPDNYAINGITISQAIETLKQFAAVSPQSAVDYANGMIYPTMIWDDILYHGDMAYIVNRAYSYHYFNEL